MEGAGAPPQVMPPGQPPLVQPSLVQPPPKTELQLLSSTVPGCEAADLEPLVRDRANTWPSARPLGPPKVGDEPLEGPQPGPGKTRKKPLGSEPAAKKPNPWGEESYAELIAKAINSSPAQRMKLSEIYGWFVDNNPYFAERKDVEAAAGWKNSIRHNLSLHSRFMRIQNEGAGKSSWWVINPDAKPGKASRRRAQTMDGGGAGKGSPASLKEKKKRVRAKVEAMRACAQPNPGLSPAISDSSDSFYEAGHFSALDAFRDRSGSNLSNYSISSNPAAARLSPQLEELEEPWLPNGAGLPNGLSNGQPTGGRIPPLHPHQAGSLISPDLLDMATNMRLHESSSTAALPPPYSLASAGSQMASPSAGLPAPSQLLNGGHPSPSGTSDVAMPAGLVSPVKMEPMSSGSGSGCSFSAAPGPFTASPRQMKSEPPAYQELYPTAQLSSAQLSSPMLREVLGRVGPVGPMGLSAGLPSAGVPPGPPEGRAGATGLPPQMIPGQPGAGLPSDISDIQYPAQQGFRLDCDVDAILRYEINCAQAQGKPLDFDGMDSFQN